MMRHWALMGALLVALCFGATGCIGEDSDCGPGETCTCGELGDCELACEGGDCTFECAGEGDCDFDCPDGGCTAICSGSGTCTLSCTTDCELSCEGSGECINF